MLSKLDEFGLVQGAWQAGIIQAAVEETGIDDLARRVGREPARVRDIARALDAYGIFDRVADEPPSYVLAERWQPLLLNDPPIALPNLFAYAAARTRMIRDSVAGGVDYWDADERDQLAYAVGVALDPTSTQARQLLRQIYQLDDEQHRLFQNGGRYLELGCGAAGGANTMLQIYPKVSAVGLELSEALAEEARARATKVGVADRFTVVCGDVRDFDEPESFDFVFWSQFFFPGSSRRDALRVAFRSLRRGGVIRAPLMTAPVTSTEDLRTDDGREYAVDRVVHGGWGVPERSADDLAAEIAQAGFERAGFKDVGFARLITAYKP